METIIKIRDLRKVYRVGKEKVVALGNINLDIHQGEICCILGTSGSGKSTLLNQLAGLEKPTKGKVLINKINISNLNENQLAKFRQENIGFIFQSYNLLAALTALENVSMPLMFKGVSRRKRNKVATQMLKAVGLGGRIHHRPGQMSGGQQQRVGIARAFVARPKIIFADEPTGNLDSKTTIDVMEMMVNMCREKNHTFVLVTHDKELSLFADRIITLIDGAIVSDEHNQSVARTKDQIASDKAKAKEAQEQQDQQDEALSELDEADADTPLPEASGAEESPPIQEDEQELSPQTAQPVV